MRFSAPVGGLLLGAASVGAAYNISTVTEHCDDIWDFTGDAGLETSVQVTNVTYIAANGSVPAYCSVVMYANAYTGIEMYLPAEGSDWKGIFSSHGCGGSCGLLGLDYVYGYGTGPYGQDLLERGYVASMTDMGHEETDYPTTGLSSWLPFRNNRTVEINFGYQSTHYLAVAGKALTEYYYNASILHSFFRGGSTGGRQGLMIAERFPYDYDAIIVGYAAVNETGIGGLQFPWLAQASAYNDSSFILTNADLDIIHAGAVAACDANDGLVDGIIDPSYACDFDVMSLLCSSNTTSSNTTTTTSSSCLTSVDKALAAQKMYSYPSNSKTSQLISARYVPGSEYEWTTWVTAYGWEFAESFTRDAAFQTDLPYNWSLSDYDWETYPYMLGDMESIYSVGNGDLSIFRARGGKIIHYQGWADANVAPEWNMHFYQHIVETNGGLNATQDFYRFFQYPGMAHIDLSDNSTVAWRCAYYDYLEDWYLNGIAPDSLVVNRFNLTANETIDVRSYFPYPLVPKYVGSGVPGEDPENWVGVVVEEGRRGVV